MRAVARRAVRVAMIVAVVASAAGGFALWQAYTGARGQLAESRCDGYTSFVAPQWMDTTMARGKLAVRGCMVSDLLEKHELRGLTRAEVVALIGAPDPPDVFREYDMVYW